MVYQVDHVPSVPIGPSSLLGMPPFLPPGQVTGMHPFVLHQPGVPHSMPAQVPQSHVGNFHSIPAMSSLQQWQNQQVLKVRYIFPILFMIIIRYP